MLSTMSPPLFALGPTWQQPLQEELNKPYLQALATFVAKERKEALVFPPQDLVFNAFWKTPFDKVKVVIIGQDPYHGIGQAHGLSFSVPPGSAVPPSLKNIYKELESDLGIPKPDHGCLLAWAEQGVFLLNATLTVRAKEPMSHHGRGWEVFTDAVVQSLAGRKEPTVFILWGKNAEDKCRQIQFDPEIHHVIKSPHPSPFSAYNGFFGSRPFSQANSFLSSKGLSPIDWHL